MWTIFSAVGGGGVCKNLGTLALGGLCSEDCVATVKPLIKGHVIALKMNALTTVEPLNKGHLGISHFVPLLRGCPFLGGKKMYYCYGGKGVLKSVLCREVVPFSEGPLPEVPLYFTNLNWHQQVRVHASFILRVHCSRTCLYSCLIRGGLL